jgi:hypothetical protein
VGNASRAAVTRRSASGRRSRRFAGGGEPDQPAGAERGQPCRVGELGGDQPTDLGAQHVGKRHRQAGKGAVELAEQLVFRCGADRDPSGPVCRPGGQFIEHRRPRGGRDSAAGQQQLGDRLQIDRVGLHPPPAHHPALLGDVRRIELEHLPAGRPGRRDQ